MPGPGNRMRNQRGYGRNMDFNQGSGGQSFNSGKPALASSGPLMTNHLQLHELDLELALLKRKREMIETQHNLLVSDNRFGGSNQFGFNQAPQSYDQRSEPTRNFSNFYNDRPGQQDRFTSQGGVKRRAIDPWDNSSSPKRFNAPSGPKRTQTRYEPRANNPPPLMGTSFRPRRPAPSATRTNFKPTKVTKPKPNAAPNKLNSLPVAERKNLVAQASGLLQKSNENIYMYAADKPPNPKLVGRLELALGTILRDMRTEYGDTEPHVVTFINIAGQRALKQAIRERIRSIMIGKMVGPGHEIVALYRKEHPKETDVELLDKARESIVQRGNLAIDIIKQGNPERYFRNNFKRLLDASLNTMFERMEKLYTNVETSEKPLQEIIDSMLQEAEKTLQEKKEEDGDAEMIENGENQSADNSATEAILEVKENGAAADENAAAEDGADKTEPEGDAAKPEGGDVKAEETETKPEDAAAASVKPEATEKAEDAPKENADTKEATTKPPRFQSKASSEELVRARFYNRLMETLMKRNLPLVLPRYKEFILRILGTESAFKETKAYLVKTTNEIVDEMANNPDAATPTKTGTPAKKILFVKVIGRPGLPKKKQMKAFLDTFHPTLIKKHRNMHNILFISFDSKENFDNILSQNGTVIANCKLEIKVSERINKNKQNEIEIPDEAQAQAKTANGDVEMDDKNDSIKLDGKNDSVKLDETLDDQINDLLTSIREEEEKNDDEPENESKDQAETENTEAETEEVKEESQNDEQAPEPKKNEEDAKTEEAVQKNVEAVKTEAPAKGTPTRASARITSTPSAIRTRRSSKLPQ